MKIYPILFAQLLAYHYIAVAAKLSDSGIRTFLICLVVLGMLFSIGLYITSNQQTK